MKPNILILFYDGCCSNDFAEVVPEESEELLNFLLDTFVEEIISLDINTLYLTWNKK